MRSPAVEPAAPEPSAPAPARSVHDSTGARERREDENDNRAHAAKLAAHQSHTVPHIEVQCTGCGALMAVLALTIPFDYYCDRCDRADPSWNRLW